MGKGTSRENDRGKWHEWRNWPWETTRGSPPRRARSPQTPPTPSPNTALQYPAVGRRRSAGLRGGPFPGETLFAGGPPAFWGTPSPFRGHAASGLEARGLPPAGAPPGHCRLRALPAAAAPRPPRVSAPPAPPRGERPREHQWEGAGRQAAPLIGCGPCIYQGAAEGERGGGGGGRGARRDPGGRCPPGGSAPWGGGAGPGGAETEQEGTGQDGTENPRSLG